MSDRANTKRQLMLSQICEKPITEEYSPMGVDFVRNNDVLDNVKICNLSDCSSSNISQLMKSAVSYFEYLS